MIDTTVKIHFQTEPCGRCNGTGQHSFNQRDGRLCWGCHGEKVRHSRLGRAAFDAYEKALAKSAGTVAVRDLEPGMRIRSQAFNSAVSGDAFANLPAAWRTVATVTITEKTREGWGVSPDGFRVNVNVTCAEITFDDDETWRAEESDDLAYWHKSAPSLSGRTRGFLIDSEEARAVRDAVRIRIARRYKGAWLDGEEPPAAPAPRLRKSADMKPEPAPAPAAKPEPRTFPNRYPGDCVRPGCGQRVEAGAGECYREGGRYVTRHKEGDCPAPVEEQASAETAPAPVGTESDPVVVLTRSKLYPEIARPGPAWRWSYNYTVNGGPNCQYGTGLTSLRDMLRRKFGRTVRIVEEWKHKPTPAPATTPAAPEPKTYTHTALTYGENGGYVEKTFEVRGPLYHGGGARLREGDEIKTGRRTNPWGDEGRKSTCVHFTNRLEVAAAYAEKSGGHVFEVEPTGDFSMGYSGDEYKSTHPLTVVRRLTRDEWHAPAQTAPAKKRTPLTEPGMYRLDGVIYRVQETRDGGRLYAKKLTRAESGKGAEFEYARGAVHRLSAVDRMTVDEAADVGREWSVCIVCTAELSNPESIARGMGPVCAKNV
ncbi:DUF6011 domain-containing protein [Streptomyces sp. NPDC088727]|uniref:DUF6011 domain-containing protein n=1 Tax=Streptomyces sp. NPDC088727 TaxID=3365875 RepID=UPI00381E3019